MDLIYLVNLVVLSLQYTGSSGLYFPVKEYHVNLPVNSKKNDRVLRVYALPSYPSTSTRGVRLVTSMRTSDVQYFRLRRDGWITVMRDITPTSFVRTKGVHNMTLKALLGNMEASVNVKITIVKAQVTCNEITRDMCFSLQKQFTLEENLRNVKFGNILAPEAFRKSCKDVTYTYSILDSFIMQCEAWATDRKDGIYDVKDGREMGKTEFGGKNRHSFRFATSGKNKAVHEFHINEGTAEVMLTKEMDAEVQRLKTFVVGCVVKRGSETLKRIQQKINISVNDVNDNVPEYESGNRVIDITHKPQNGVRRHLVDITLMDKDVNKTTYIVTITNDTNGHFAVSKPYPFRKGKKWLMVLKIRWKKPMDLGANHYSFNLVVKDTGYKGNGSNECIVPIRVNLLWNQVIAPLPRGQYNATVSRVAAQYSKIKYLPGNVNPFFAAHKPLFAITNKDGGSQLFGITPSGGLLYVKQPRKLQRFDGSTIQVLVATSSVNTTNFTIDITIQETNGTYFQECSSCAISKDKGNCITNCGMGSEVSQCTWRPKSQNSSSTPNYATCTPDVSTCPDGICDEVEQLDPRICPQDCTRNVHAPSLAHLNEKTQRGVARCHGSCWCDGPEDLITCYCQVNYNYSYNYEDEQNMYTKDIGAVANVSGDKKQVIPRTAPSIKRKEEFGFCNQSCKVTVGISAAFVGVIIAALILFKTVQRRQRAKDKVRESTRSLTAIPSNYVERRPSLTASEDWSPRFLRHKIPFDAKWEFPRKNLILDKELGEGEFGKVVKAEALNINGNDGYNTVAIKMLKDNATNAELRDLLSEFNLLKDVTHPNVIKLLGACTEQGGPFYVIVEYCELGSLRAYLRTAREVETTYLEEAPRSYDISDSEDEEDENMVSPRDLLSFAWQIAKGMQYLTEMKLVHRDLAARNVLVSAGKVVKISDFGLSRDIYEEDAYRKQSKGRIPVKWMAPESLYHQVYTSKSDVWSYGVVLWEIVTLGATPYPGVTPERLFHLLKEGHRMEKPENCSKELYTIMLQCWYDNPLYRPCFFDLANVFDKMLQQRVEYIDLNNYDRQPICDDLDDILSRVGTNYSSDDEGGDGYGNINMLPCDDDSYLTPLPRPWQDQGQCPDCGAEAVFSQTGRETDFACECSLLLRRASTSLRRKGVGVKDQYTAAEEQTRMPLVACENLEYMRTTVV